MRPYLVVIFHVRQQYMTEVSLAEHNNVVQALPSDRTDQPFGISVLPWGARQGRPPSCTAVVHEISQRDKDAFIFGEGRAGLARRQTSRDHSLPPGPGRAAPPICSDLINDRHRCAAFDDVGAASLMA